MGKNKYALSKDRTYKTSPRSKDVLAVTMSQTGKRPKLPTIPTRGFPSRDPGEAP